MSDALDRLPEAHQRKVRLAWFPSHVVAITSYLRRQLAIEAALPVDAEQIPLIALQLLKLAHATGHLEIKVLRFLAPGEALVLRLHRGERTYLLSDEELTSDLDSVFRNILRGLFTNAEFPGLVETFAFQSTMLTTLQRCATTMLEASRVDEALQVMLAGLTSGYALGFNRAALFTHKNGGFIGRLAVGPADGDDARRIWEKIEYTQMNIHQQIQEGMRPEPSRFQHYITGVHLAPAEVPGDEIKRALESPVPLLLHAGQLYNRSLAALSPTGDYVLATLQARNRVLGLLFADNCFNRAEISADHMRFLRLFIDQTALVWENLELLRSVEELARFDSLTGLLNRREFEVRVAEEQSRCRRNKQACTYLLIDVDLFKEINDGQGHPAGDRVLQTLARVLQGEMRGHDLVGRIGGDEFAVLCTGLDQEQLAATALRLGRRTMEHGISISLGAASWPMDCDCEQLPQLADNRLYRAKRAGRGCADVGGPATLAFREPGA